MRIMTPHIQEAYLSLFSAVAHLYPHALRIFTLHSE